MTAEAIDSVRNEAIEATKTSTNKRIKETTTNPRRRIALQTTRGLEEHAEISPLYAIVKEDSVSEFAQWWIDVSAEVSGCAGNRVDTAKGMARTTPPTRHHARSSRATATTRTGMHRDELRDIRHYALWFLRAQPTR